MSSVTLRVYDLSRGLARQVSPALLGKQIDGIWHTGVLVFGQEYFFGGGIQVLAPELVVARYGMQPVQEIALGMTRITQSEFEAFLREISPRFTASTYDLLTHNCNNFSNEIASFLLGTGIPRYILDLPNEALSTPLGAMLRPMLENMQREMGAGGAQPFAIPFNDPSRASTPLFAQQQLGTATASVQPTSTSANTAVALSRRFTISGHPTLHLSNILNRIEVVNSQMLCNGTAILSLPEIEAMQDIAHHVNDTVDLTPTDAHVALRADKCLQWWSSLQTLLALGPSSPLYFPSLGLFRVLLLLPTKSDAILGAKNACFDLLLRASDNDLNVGDEAAPLSSAQTVLFLSVLVNAFANPVASDLALARAAQFLPFVFRAITESTSADVRLVSAKLISNCCLALQIEEELVITTILCGCVEVLERVSREQQPVQALLEGVVVGIGRLLQNFQAARSLSVELGLGETLRRLQTSPSLRGLQPLVAEVVALI